MAVFCRLDCEIDNMSFDTLGLHEALTRSVADSGYATATDVQTQAIPPALQGRDLMVSASTGSGKTASFILPALQRVLAARGDNTKRREKGVVYGPRILVLTPTRELAIQVAKAADTYGRHVPGLRVATVVGGVPYPMQIKALRGPLDILIATPGRLLDHLQTGKAVLENVEMFVLDEADRMLDMGFIDDIRTIADHVPAARQTVMYSATFAGNVGGLARSLLREPQRIDVASHTDTHVNIEQRLHWADNRHHKDALLDHILTERDLEQALVFTSTQRDADWLADRLAELGHHVASLHGGMPQGRRNRVLQGLRSKHLRVLVATDVAARGIDVPSISHVINYGLPMKAEDYVHRIGRTGRAGRNGLAVTLAERMDVGMIRRIQHFTTQAIPVATVAGLEPQQPQPRIHADRPAAAAERPRFGGRPGAGGAGGKPFGQKKPFAARGGFRAGGAGRPGGRPAR
jgi:superfamily II DNA/RNA helicase